MLKKDNRTKLLELFFNDPLTGFQLREISRKINLAPKSVKNYLEELEKEISRCERCILHRNRTNTVPGKGPEDAEIVILGEGPGENEDRRGLPFIGRAGKVLTESLREAGKERDEVFITNVVKCRPPDNRDPKVGEIESCFPYLERQLEIVQPEIILPLGNSAVKAVLGRKGITDIRGQIIEKDGHRYFPTYHPAATLYNRKLRPQFVKDLKKAISIAEGVED